MKKRKLVTMTVTVSCPHFIGAVDLAILIGGLLALGINQWRIDRKDKSK